MESIKEIRTHIDSVQQTLKITNAMYLISSSKLRKARRQLTDVQPYFEKITRTISDILHRTAGVDHVYFDTRSDHPHKVGYIVITGDKGLAGAYNHNVLRLVEEEMAKVENPTLFLIGQSGRNYFQHKGVNIDGEFMYTSQDPTVYRAREIGDTFIELFRKGHLDEVYVVYTEMVTPMQMEPKIVKLLPLDRDAFPWKPRRSADGSERHVVTYVPSPEHVLNHIVPSYLKGLAVRHAGGVLLLRAERPHERYGHRHRQRPVPAEGTVAALQPCPSVRHHPGDHRDRGRRTAGRR